MSDEVTAPTEGILWCHGQNPDDVAAMMVAHSLAEAPQL